MAQDMAKMKLIGLGEYRVIEVAPLRAIDLVVSYQTYGLGGGEWSIEAKTSNDQSVWGPSIMEWVGNNGTGGYEADDLWAEVEAWEKDPQGGLKVIRKGYKYKSYHAPDGTWGSYAHFCREAQRGRLHGLLLQF